MNKGQLVDEVASALGESKAAASKAVEAVIASIATGIEHHDTVTIAGFGTFAKKDRAARTGRNPSTGERLEIRACKTVSFRPSPALKLKMEHRSDGATERRNDGVLH